jgi:hypothetical protein
MLVVAVAFVAGVTIGVLAGLRIADSSAGNARGAQGESVTGRHEGARPSTEGVTGRESVGRDGASSDSDTSGDAASRSRGDTTGSTGGADPGAAPEPPSVALRRAPPADGRVAEKPVPLYVVIDDVGNNLAQLEPFLETDLPMTFAVLPQRRYSGLAVSRIAAAGEEAILHLPMEARNGNDPGAGAITTSLNSQQISARLTDNLTSVPGVIGVNNHMGSKATADRQTMEAVFRYLKSRNLFFLDSRTTAETVGKSMADKFQVSFAERHVFLDNEPNRDYIRQAVEQGMDIARKRGHAVLIGHVMVTEVAEVLEEMYPFIRDEGFDLHHLSDLVLGPKDDDTWD